MPKVIPQSPNAAALGKFGDIPVSHYTGTTSISIPLHTIETGDITLPITLDYHTGGIRVKELAGWVGLGWALNASGVVNRQMRDKDDLEIVNGLFDLVTKGRPAKILPNQPGMKLPWAIFDLSYNQNFPKSIETTAGEVFDFDGKLDHLETLDSEYDIFTYNFAGKSGRFIFTRSGDPIFERKDDLIIIKPEGKYGNFVLKDDRGFTYFFQHREVASQNPYVGNYVTSWYLSRIESPRGFAVDFEYETSSLPVITGENYVGFFGGCTGISGSHTITGTSFSTAYILKRITYQQGYVEFELDEQRTDYNGKRVVGLRVFRTGMAEPIREFEFKYSLFDPERMRLDKVVEKSSQNTLPPYEFKYHTEVTNPPLNSRAIDHWGYFNDRTNTTGLPRYIGPVKVGTNQQSGDGGPYVPVYLTYDALDLPGANRESNAEKMKIFSLSELKYPTGGRTEIWTEANTYTLTPSQLGSSQNPNTYVQRDHVIRFYNSEAGEELSGSISDFIPGDAIGVTAVVGFICYSQSNGCSTFRGNSLYPAGSIYVEIDGNRRDITGENTTCGGPQCQASDLSVTNESSYKFWIDGNIPSEYVMTTIKLSWYEPNYLSLPSSRNYLVGGGLRVSAIKNYDHNGLLVKSTNYDYHSRNGTSEHSWGKLLSPIYYWRTYWESDANGLFCPTFQRYSNSIIPLTSTIGYDRVVETVSSETCGKTVYDFINERDSLFGYNYSGDPWFNERPAGIPNLSRKLNGSLIRKTDYKIKPDGTFHPVVRVENIQRTALENNIYSYQLETIPGPGPLIRRLYIYPAIRSERVFLDKTVVTTFHPDDSTHRHKTETTYIYGDNHQNPIKTRTSNSDGRQETSIIVYTPDYGLLSDNDFGIKNLADENIILPVEKYNVIQDRDANGNLTDYVTMGQFTTFKPQVPLVDKLYRLQTHPPIQLSTFRRSDVTPNSISMDTRYEELIEFDLYDEKGNIQSVSKVDDSKTVYLWDANKQYPIAEVRNADFERVAYTSFENGANEGSWMFSGAGSGATPARTGEYFYPLSPSTPIARNLAQGKYTLEYYAKAPINVAGGSIVDLGSSQPDINGWRLYRKQITLNSETTVTLSVSSGNVDLDEVRIYPEGASVTTYTYAPSGNISSSTDKNMIVTYYEYDAFNRLQIVRDDNKNILKSFTYHFVGEN